MARALGQPFMPWQRDAAMVGCEIDPETGGPAYREVIVTVPRQQGKTTLFLSWQINRCTSSRWVQPQRSAFTAQSGKDARDKWLDELFPLIRRSRKFRPGGPLVARIYEGMGNEYIRFKNGSLIRLLSTSTSSGHSKTLHQAVLDEIWHDQDARREQGLRPAMLTVWDAQVLTCSTAGNETSVVLDRKIRQGRAAAEADSGRGIAYIEYSAPDGWDPDDEESYFGFMPALCPDPPCRCGGGKWRHTVTLDVIRGERDSMEAPEFARAYGNLPTRTRTERGDWEVIPLLAWAACADEQSEPSGEVALSVVFSGARDRAAIGLGGRRGDRLWHAEVADYRTGTSWAVPRLAELAAKHSPVTVAVDGNSHEASLIPDLEAAGVPVMKFTGREVAQAFGLFYDAVGAQGLRHRNQDDLTLALAGATTRDVGDSGRAWGRRKSGVDISPLVAVTQALWAHSVMVPELAGDPGAWVI